MAQRDAGLDLRIRLDGAQETLKAFRALPKEASTELRDASLNLSRILAAKIADAGRAQGGQAALLAGTVKAKYDRVPAVKVGGTMGLGRHRTPAWRLLIGSEFGHGGQGGAGRGSRNFAPHGFPARHSPQGIWIFPTVRENEGEIGKAWLEVADEIVQRFTAGG